MPGIMDYISWRGDLTLDKSPFNEVDALIFTQLSYVDFTEIVSSDIKECISVKDAWEKYSRKKDDYLGALLPADITELFKAMAEAERYKNMRLSGYVNLIDTDSEEQFSAILIHMGRSIFLSYRGTDDTLVGWKEDFNLAYMERVPSQREAADYLDRVVPAFRITPIYAGGHSKGGNLAVYASVNCKKNHRKHIKEVYNFDGPGFLEEVLKQDVYSEMSEKIVNILPEGSVVGRLLNHLGREKIVKCEESMILQHIAFNWLVMGREFVKAERLSDSSVLIDNVLSGWISNMTKEERESFVEALFDVFKNSEAKTLTDIMNDKMGFFKAFGAVDRDKKKEIRKSMSKIIEEAAKLMMKKNS